MFTRGFIMKCDYATYKNKLTAMLRRARRLYYYKQFMRESKNSRKLWNRINSLLGNGSCVQMERLIVDTSVLTGQDMVNYANSHFVNIANNLTRGIQNSVPYSHTSEPNLVSFMFHPTDVGEVRGVIKSLNNKGNNHSEMK